MNLLHSTPKNVVRGELLKRGMSLSGFAKRYGFPIMAVQLAFRRHCGNYDSNPSGAQTKAIIQKLYDLVNEPFEEFFKHENESSAQEQTLDQAANG